jgi:hypothetical protein
MVVNLESTSVLNLANSSSCNLVADGTGTGLVADATDFEGVNYSGNLEKMIYY